MEMHILVTRDIKANVYSLPFYAADLESIKRNFQTQCTTEDPKNSLWTHPQDFELWHVGQYDDNFGTGEWFDMKNRKQLDAGSNYTRPIKTLGPVKAQSERNKAKRARKHR